MKQVGNQSILLTTALVGLTKGNITLNNVIKNVVVSQVNQNFLRGHSGFGA